MNMNGKGLYLSTMNALDESRTQSGVDRKIISQIRCLNEAGLECSFHYCEPPHSLLRRGLGSLPGISDGITWPNPNHLVDVSYLYIRRPLYSSRQLIKFLSESKRLNPTIKIILEIPTYPYDAEMNSPELLFAKRKEFKYRKQWRFVIDRIADLSGADELFGIKTLHIINGIDLREIDTRKPSKDENVINIVFPAFFGPWHGCDLLIDGMADYYRNGGTRNLLLHIAGGGKYVPLIEQQVHSLQLDGHVIIHGELDRNELNELYDKCTLAVGCLGLHRRDKNTRDSSIKTREYLAKGIPFFYAGKVDVLESNPVDFCLQLESKEQPVDMRRVISFYDSLYQKYDERDLISAIRSYAENNVSMEKAMSEVIEYLKA